jgi:hypothetical protein
MSAPARIATLLVLAIHLTAAAATCPSAKLHDREPESGALAGSAAHPCPAHAGAGNTGSTWLDSLCPCGCESGAPPSIDGSRVPAALLLAQIAALGAPDRAVPAFHTLRFAGVALAPPDHVPLPVA